MNRMIRELVSIAMRERHSSDDRPRVPEATAMNEMRSVKQFHAGGAELAGMQAVYDLSAQSLDALVPRGGCVVDLGVGSGRALGRLLAMRPDVHATGVDLAPNMLAEARQFLDAQGVGERATLVEGDLTSLPAEVAERRWDTIACVWTLHHLPDTERLRAALDQVAQMRARGGGAVWLLDFQRLRDPASFPALQAALEPEVSPVLHADAIASEAAAFTHDELRCELDAAGLDDLDSGLSRPIPWLQTAWAGARRSTQGPSKRPQPNARRLQNWTIALP